MNYPRRPRERHRLSITGIATKALAAYGAAKLVGWAWTKYRSEDTEDNQNENFELHDDNINLNQPLSAVHQQHNANVRDHQSRRNLMRKRRHQVNKCYLETIVTLETFMNHKLKQIIEKNLDFSTQTKQLKEMKKSKQIIEKSGVIKEKLWDDIKVKSITRMFSTIYAHTLLTLTLTIQIHLLGGRIFRDKLDSRNRNGPSEESCDYDYTHKVVLMNTFEYFFENGVLQLIAELEAFVENETEHWVVLSGDDLGSVTMQDFSSITVKIRSIERKNTFVDFFFPMNQARAVDELQQNIIDEVLDIMESPVFLEAKDECLSLSFETMKVNGWAKLFRDESSPELLVNLVGQLKKVTNTFYEAPSVSNSELEQMIWAENPMKFPNPYIKGMDRLESLKELGDISFN